MGCQNELLRHKYQERELLAARAAARGGGAQSDKSNFSRGGAPEGVARCFMMAGN